MFGNKLLIFIEQLDLNNKWHTGGLLTGFVASEVDWLLWIFVWMCWIKMHTILLIFICICKYVNIFLPIFILLYFDSLMYNVSKKLLQVCGCKVMKCVKSPKGMKVFLGDAELQITASKLLLSPLSASKKRPVLLPGFGSLTLLALCLVLHTWLFSLVVVFSLCNACLHFFIRLMDSSVVFPRQYESLNVLSYF